MRTKLIIVALLSLGLLANAVWAAPDATVTDADNETIGRTPPRLSYLEGQVSFWRPGAQDWVEAQINTALAPGDQLIVNGQGGLEVQIGAQAFVRGGTGAQIGLETREPDFLRFRVISGQAAFDIRNLTPGRTVEVDTTQAVFVINSEGYYRFGVTRAQTTFVTRRTGRATVTPIGSTAVLVEPDEAVAIQGAENPILAFQVVPALDDWDNWNYARTDQFLEARSLRYLSPGTYGAGDLDRYGAWRTLPTYGSVWVPSGVAPGWAPYSSGRWMHDPYYGWTWVDTAPWGWAPYHYGRWVYVHNYWCWAPGPIVRRAVYAPALVAFLSQPGLSVSIGIGGPPVGWVCLGWGEPLIPWWGRPGFIHRPWWGGWGGPHIVNNRAIHRRTIVKVEQIQHYRNTQVLHAINATAGDDFGRAFTRRHRHDRLKNDAWRPLPYAPQIRRGKAGHTPAPHGSPPPYRSHFSAPANKHHDRGSASVTTTVPGKNIQPAARPNQVGRPLARPFSSNGGQSEKKIISTPSANHPAPGHRNKSTASPDRYRPQKHHQVIAPITQPSNANQPDSGRRGAATGADSDRHRKSSAGPPAKQPNAKPAITVRPLAPAVKKTPAARPQLQTTRPFRSSVGNAGDSPGSGKSLRRGSNSVSRPAVRIPDRQISHDVPAAVPRIQPRQLPAGGKESTSQAFRIGQNRPADRDSSTPARGLVRESRQQHRTGGSGNNAPPGAESVNGSGRRPHFIKP